MISAKRVGQLLEPVTSASTEPRKEPVSLPPRLSMNSLNRLASALMR